MLREEYFPSVFLHVLIDPAKLEMALFRSLLLLLGFLYFCHVSADTPLTLEEVNAQVAKFLQGLQNGVIVSRSAPSGCALAVGFYSLPDRQLIDYSVRLP